jgi:hypothetical protein
MARSKSHVAREQQLTQEMYRARVAGQVAALIKPALEAKKIATLRQRLACMRIARNPIMDNYLMRKVFLRRLDELV